jgi:hypothetical protein
MKHDWKQWADDHLDLRHNAASLLIGVGYFGIPAATWALVSPSAVWTQVGAAAVGSAVGFVGGELRRQRRRALAASALLLGLSILHAVGVDQITGLIQSAFGMAGLMVLVLALLWYRARRHARVDTR